MLQTYLSTEDDRFSIAQDDSVSTSETEQEDPSDFEYVNIWITRYRIDLMPETDFEFPEESRLLIKGNEQPIVRSRATSFVKGFNQKEKRSPCGLWAMIISANNKLRPGEKLVM
jgi:hypothetical protein